MKKNQNKSNVKKKASHPQVKAWGFHAEEHGNTRNGFSLFPDQIRYFCGFPSPTGELNAFDYASKKQCLKTEIYGILIMI